MSQSSPASLTSSQEVGARVSQGGSVTRYHETCAGERTAENGARRERGVRRMQREQPAPKDALRPGERLSSHQEQVLPEVLLPKYPQTELRACSAPAVRGGTSAERLTRIRRHLHGYSFLRTEFRSAASAPWKNPARCGRMEMPREGKGTEMTSRRPIPLLSQATQPEPCSPW